MSETDKHFFSFGRRHLMPFFFGGIAMLFPVATLAMELTLEKAIEHALNKTARGDIIEGKLDVAQQNFDAKRINFYVPEISINGSIPGYRVDESYRFFGGSPQKQLYKTDELNFTSFIELNQSLITGGDLTITANLTKDNNSYPDTRSFDFSGDPVASGTFVEEDLKQGFFNFSLSQPLFRPSQAKYELNNRRDERDIARMIKISDEAALKREVTQAYLSLLQAEVKENVYADKLEFSKIKANIDSSKFSDGIMSEEDLLESTSFLLDAELEKFEFETQSRDQKREMALLLDLDAEEAFTLAEPERIEPLDETQKQGMLSNWENSIDIIKARKDFEKAERAAAFTAAGHGIKGDLNASYSLGRGDIETQYTDDTIADDIKTTGWTVALNVRVPVWDGGAGGAEVKAA